jgi:indole-3-glycerol phosphate synthase
MTSAVPDILSRIVETKQLEVKELRASRRSFRSAISGRPAIIAEVKKASPSRGLLTPSFDPAALAAAYAEGGAAALSVLTDREYFQGSLDDLGAARRATQLPVLRKDFILDETQIAEAFAAGADAILLIAAILDAPALRRLREFAGTLALDVLVEAHDEAELDRAIESGATILGVNNRDLHTFDVSLETSLRLARRMPAGVVAVSESGIRTRADVQRLLDAGYSAFLVGEHLMKSPDPAAALRELLG